ncbi:MAG: LysM peptidoglycan-binding domain-containing protein [Ruminococcaceae bacterium]|nr:LysM peptidoglycan-binding domain-containing protein [Oscillospiraceae bacterium]
MTNIKKGNVITTIIYTLQNLRCTPVCGREERAEYRRKKALRKKAYTVATVVMIVTLLTCGMLIAFASNVSDTSIAYSTVEVEAGDTLWSIAKENCPDSDPRDIIRDICEINGIDHHTIYAGMILQIPAC